MSSYLSYFIYLVVVVFVILKSSEAVWGSFDSLALLFNLLIFGSFVSLVADFVGNLVLWVCYCIIWYQSKTGCVPTQPILGLFSD